MVRLAGPDVFALRARMRRAMLHPQQCSHCERLQRTNVCNAIRFAPLPASSASIPFILDWQEKPMAAQLPTYAFSGAVK